MRTRVAALAALATVALTVAPATATAAPDGPVAGECRKTADQLTTPCYGADVLVRDGQAVATPERHAAAVAAFERSWAHRALSLQSRLAGDVGMVDAPWVGTHNSFNAIAEVGPTLSSSDANQQLTIADQLRIGVRSLELDVHWFPSASAGGARAPVVCHAQGRHEGCTAEKALDEVLAPIAAWVDAHPREVLLVYLEDHLDGSEGRQAAADALRGAFGTKLHEAPGSCAELPDALTRDEVLAAGAQVVVVSSCRSGAAWPGGAVHAWSRHRESRPVGFEDSPSCGPDFTREDFDTRLIRYFEDSTWLTAAASDAGAASRDDGLTPETTAAMVRCGVDLLGFDQLVPGDGRLEAAVWSWAPGEPEESGDCAVARASDGRWTAERCAGALPAACRTSDGDWVVTAKAPPRHAAERCAAAGATHAAPRTGREQALLRDAAGERAVLLGLRRSGDGWRALDPR